mmetsp:Transcript_36374/g.35999  ORF Transcript_36374/g.35999 Transcript_36374/m.35999 type:complete len:197 (+) Transcript_36374:1205-1795(+)
MTALRSHKFFDNIDFDNLFEATSPIPKVDKMMNSIKSNMISKYAIKNKSKRKRPKSPVKAKTSIDLSHFNVEPLETQDKMKIEDWKTEKKINITHTELIQLRSRLLFFYRSVISLTTDEPALYIYGLKSGVLRERYDLKNCKINIKGKNKIKFASKTKQKYKKISNAFKIKKHQKHHRDSTNPKGLVDVLKEIKTQ